MPYLPKQAQPPPASLCIYVWFIAVLLPHFSGGQTSSIAFTKAQLGSKSGSAMATLVGPGRAVNPYHFTSVKAATYTKAAVSCAHPLASQVGAQIMKQGGNAFDAAIAVQWALAVVYPGAGNIGGGGFMVAHMAGPKATAGKLLALDYRETAPAAASQNMYLDSAGNMIKNASLHGHRAVGVPGTVAGLYATLPYAKLPMAMLMAPAITLAEKGFVLTKTEAKKLNDSIVVFKQYNTALTAFVKEKPWQPGDTLVQPELAQTLRRISKAGRAEFYSGKTAQLLVAEMQRGGGLITASDLKNYKPIWRKALSFSYKKHVIVSMPPPSSGGLLLLQMLKMLEHRPLASYGVLGTKAVQLIVETERRAYADRAAHLGDPDFWHVPMATLTSDAYLAGRMASYDSTRATPSTQIQAGVLPEKEETTHISIIDPAGTMVAVTTTLNGTYGSSTVVGGAGFLLNNEMDDFSSKPGVPNMYGAIGGQANAIAPGKRMLSSMTPCLILKNNKPLLVCGTPGGTTIPTSVLQTVLGLLDFKQTAAQAIRTPKFHHQWLPDIVYVEKAFPDDVADALTLMGYKVVRREPIGRTELIRILPSGKRETAADIRGDDSVSGF